jgi:hypothetical protein
VVIQRGILGEEGGQINEAFPDVPEIDRSLAIGHSQMRHRSLNEIQAYATPRMKDKVKQQHKKRKEKKRRKKRKKQEGDLLIEINLKGLPQVAIEK